MTTRRHALLGLGALLLVPSLAAAKDPVFRDKHGLAIRGADPIAYFEEGAHRPGSPEFTAEYGGATWRFVSAEHRDRFVSDPVRWGPQYGGYCSYAVSQGYTASIDPEAFTVVGDKLYLNYSKTVEKKWRKNRDAYIRDADRNWPGVLDK